MLIVILIISFIIGFFIAMSDDDFLFLDAFLIIGCIVGMIYCSSKIVGQRTIEQRIEMYQTENTNIETKVKETVRAYMNYEENTYKELIESADLTTLVIKYPELNSNELIKAEINLYIENNNKIKKLKEDKINITIYKWWLYFGK